MKKLMITGALLGLISGAGLGLNHGASWPEVLWRGCLVSICAGFLMRWWGRVWIQCLQQAQAERLAASEPNELPLTQHKP